MYKIRADGNCFFVIMKMDKNAPQVQKDHKFIYIILT